MRRAALLLAAVFVIGTEARSQNLIDNGKFDTDVSGWLAVGGTVLEWSAVDELDSALSGSAKVTVANVGGGHNLVSLCIPVIGGTSYAFGIDARLPEGQPLVNPRVSTFVGFSPGMACNPSTLAAVGSTIELQGAWGNSQGWATAPPGALSAGFVAQIGIDGDGGSAVVELDNAFFLADRTCGPSPTALCLNQGRFRVIAEWETKHGETGYGRARPLTDDSGYFWFFDDANVELVTKLIDACPTQFGTFWLFAAGLTDVETVIRVHDTHADVERVYVNPQETPFEPIQDTDAFATCP